MRSGIPKRGSKPVGAAAAKMRLLKQLICSDAPEQALRYHGFQSIAGVDEVGRGALFGPVVAAAVILPECLDALAETGLKDSKQMLREDRERLDLQIRGMALAVSVAEVDAETIDRINIYQASRMAMLLAVRGLALIPDHLLIDAMRIDHDCPQTKLIYGDSLSLSIAAASVVAKVYRDARARCGLSEVWIGVAQGLWNAFASGGADGTWALRSASAKLFACGFADGFGIDGDCD
jgi:ribonuclease HII